MSPARPNRPSRQPSRTVLQDPNTPSPGATRRGETAVGQPHVQRIERGIVVQVDANGHVYRVRCNSGPILDGIPRFRAFPGDLALLEVGTPVVVSWGLGSPYISGLMPLETARPSNDAPEGVTDVAGHGGQDPTLDRNMGRSARAAGEPNDLLPGDAPLMGPDGASVAALHGRIAQLRGSEMAKVRVNGADDAVDIFAALYRLVTWMGESRYTNDDGKTNFSWLGGADQLTQTGADEEKYTIHLNVGDAGNLIRLEVTTPDQQPVFRFHVDPRGHCEIFSRGGLNQHSGASEGQIHPQRFHGTRLVEIEGQDQHRVSGEALHTYEAGRTLTISLDENQTIGQDYNLTIHRNWNQQVGGNAEVIVQGTYQTVVLEDCTVLVEGTSRYYVHQLGSGNIDFEPSLGKFRIITRNLDAVELTDNPSSHGTKYEELEEALNALVKDYNQFKNVVMNHTHVLLGNAGPYPVTGNALASVALSPTQPFTGSWTNAKSLIVKLS